MSMHHHDGNWVEENMLGGDEYSMIVRVQFSSHPDWPVFNVTRVGYTLFKLSGLTYYEWFPVNLYRFTYWTRESLT